MGVRLDYIELGMYSVNHMVVNVIIDISNYICIEALFNDKVGDKQKKKPHYRIVGY